MSPPYERDAPARRNPSGSEVPPHASITHFNDPNYTAAVTELGAGKVFSPDVRKTAIIPQLSRSYPARRA